MSDKIKGDLTPYAVMVELKFPTVLVTPHDQAVLVIQTTHPTMVKSLFIESDARQDFVVECLKIGNVPCYEKPIDGSFFDENQASKGNVGIALANQEITLVIFNKNDLPREFAGRLVAIQAIQP